jgi:hypothetical protein
VVCGLTNSALSEADTTDKKIIDRKMSATATTTLSDTLVVGRQPQQSVGVRSVSSFFLPPLHPSPISSPFPIPLRPGNRMVSIPNSHPQTAPVGFGFHRAHG